VLRFSGIPARMALVLLLASVPAFAIFGAYAVYRYSKEKETALEQLQQQAISIASTRGILLDQADAMLRSLAGLPQLRNMSRDPSACSDVLATALRETTQYANIAAADLDGRVICRGIAPGPTGQVIVTDRAWFQRVVARRDFIVGNYAVGRGSGEASVHVAYPIYDSNGRMIGAVNAGIRLWWLRDRLAALNLPRGMVVALLDSDGTILVRHPATEEGSFVGKKMPEAAGMIAGQGRGITEARMLDGVYRTMAVEPLGGMRWNDISVVVAVEPSYLWDPVWKLIGLQFATFATVVILGMVAALLGAYWMVVRPVRVLEEAVLAYSTGHRTARAKETARGEIGQLARTFNVMAERINLQEKALKETSDQKTRYLAIAGHDLRQPLQVMMMKLESGIANSNGRMRSSLETAQRAAERLSGQLDLLANIVRADLEGSGLQLQIHEVRMQDVLEDVASSHRETALAKGIGFHAVESRLAVCSNRDALLTIVNNLVLNAINYTSEGRILIGCRRRGAMCRIEVHDTGPGIPYESRVKIFKAFTRLDPEASFGLGLGLSIARETAAQLKHTLTLHSAPGKGSCFCVEVPLWNGR
jgi:signal transduction histidine kinase